MARRGWSRWGWMVLGVLLLEGYGTLLGAEPHPARTRYESAIVLPRQMEVQVVESPEGKNISWREIERRFHAGDSEIVDWVVQTLRSADDWAERSDTYYRNLFHPQTPAGNAYTISCPLHPLETRGWIPFQWNPDHPWRLYCKRCVAEGRKFPYYPNPRYPDEGTGCRPTDEVWKEDHTRQWSKANQNIPWDHWDGQTHGEENGDVYYFLSYAQTRIFFELIYRHQILTTLARAHLFARHLYPEGSAEWNKAPLHAHKAKVIMLTMARAILGDSYLRTVVACTSDEYLQTMATFYEGNLPEQHYPGYTKDSRVFYPPYIGAGTASYWLAAFSFIHDSFTGEEVERKIPAIIERGLTSVKGDEERLAEADMGALRQGILELHVDPYRMVMGGNLSGTQAFANLSLGFLLKNPEIAKSVARDVKYFFRNSFNGEGLGVETSPHYTNCRLYTGTSTVLSMLHGLEEGFGPMDTFWDPEGGCLNPYKDPDFKDTVLKMVHGLLPDGHCMPWCDSGLGTTLRMEHYEHVENYGGGIPAETRPYFDIQRSADGHAAVTLKEDLDLPCRLFHYNFKAVFRTGKGGHRTVLTLDWEPWHGHCHYGPFNLLLYAQGHELLYDQGYLNWADSDLTPGWLTTAEAHNTALVRRKDGNPSPGTKMRGSLIDYEISPEIKMVELAERDRSRLRNALGTEEGIYGRTVALVGNGESPSYLLDFFRIRGGAIHDYHLHSMGRKLKVEDVELTPLTDPAMSLYKASGFAYPTSGGAKYITSLRRGRTDDLWSAVWSEAPNWWQWEEGSSSPMDRQVRLRLTMLGAPGTEIFAGRSVGARYDDMRDKEERMNLICVRRRPTEDHIDSFVGVIEAYRDQPHVLGIEAFTVEEPTEGAVGIKVTTRSGIDYGVSSLSAEDVVRFRARGEDDRLRFAGRFGFVSTEADGRLNSLFFTSGQEMGWKGYAVHTKPACTGTLVDFNDARKTLTVESSDEIPDGTLLAGRVILLEHHRQSASFTIARVRRLEGNRFLIFLDGTPHVVRNILLVQSVKEGTVSYQPRAILYRDLDYYVYRRGANGSPVLMGPWRDFPKGASGLEALKPGDELWVTDLVKGRDRIRIPNSVFLKRLDETAYLVKACFPLDLSLPWPREAGFSLRCRTAEQGEFVKEGRFEEGMLHVHLSTDELRGGVLHLSTIGGR